MAEWKSFWGNLSSAARSSLALGALLIVVGVSAAGWWMLRAKEAILFSDLSERDMAAMTAELDKLKVRYRIEPEARALFVDESLVHGTRLKLMGSPMALQGAVGFELFNTSDFAMTEFAQKVNYQRALQGELTRTILALDQVQHVRVHLVLPEQGLFRRTAGQAKASVTLQLKPGHTLEAAQVAGIQRLVSASVPEVNASDVAVLDQAGHILSRALDSSTDAALASAGLDLKQSTEAYLTRKAMQVAERLFGRAEALVSVDAVFTHDQARTTTEEVLAARSTAPDVPAAGVIVRERTSQRDPGQTPDKASASTHHTSETDYQTGKRVEQVTSPAGQLKRLQVAVVIRQSLQPAEIARAKEVISAAVGLQPQRGDVISLQTLASPLGAAPPAAEQAAALEPAPSPTAASQPVVETASAPTASGIAAAAQSSQLDPSAPSRAPQPRLAGLDVVNALGVALAAGAMLLLGMVAWRQRHRRRSAAATVQQGTTDRSADAQALASLSAEQREAVLAQVRGWLASSTAATSAPSAVAPATGLRSTR